MDTRRHVSITPAHQCSQAGLAWRSCEIARAIVTAQAAALRGKSEGQRCDAAVEGGTRHPRMGTAKEPGVSGGERV